MQFLDNPTAPLILLPAAAGELNRSREHAPAHALQALYRAVGQVVPSLHICGVVQDAIWDGGGDFLAFELGFLQGRWYRRLITKDLRTGSCPRR